MVGFPALGHSDPHVVEGEIVHTVPDSVALPRIVQIEQCRHAYEIECLFADGGVWSISYRALESIGADLRNIDFAVLFATNRPRFRFVERRVPRARGRG